MRPNIQEMSASKTLRLRLSVGALLPLVIAVAAQASYTLVSQRDAMDRGLENKARALAGLMVNVAGPNIAFDDDKGVDDGLAFVAGDPDFGFAAAIGPTGRSIAFRGDHLERAELAPTLVPVASPTVLRRGSLLVAAAPVITDGHQVGTVFIALRSETVRAQATHMAGWATGISVAGILIAVVVVLVLAGKIVRDFDARIRMELELRQAQRLETVGRLAAGIAHEINTPIQFISDSLQFVQGGLGELTQLLDCDIGVIARAVAGEPVCELATVAAAAADDADLPYLREQLPLAVVRALEGVSRVTKIVRSMRNYTHPDGREMVAVDLNEAIAGTLTIAHTEYKYVAELETDFGELPLVTCHIGEINQVIINLVVNAAHAISDVVGTTGKKGRLTVRTWCDGLDVVVAIHDTGGGIPASIRDRVFDPFFTTKEIGKGTGQGLAISRSVIVDKHGGSLTFESKSGEGTTFQIRIPTDGSPARVAHAA